jgi:hypothetical protein
MTAAMPAGLEDLFDNSEPEFSLFQEDFAAKIMLAMKVREGVTTLRMRCSGPGVVYTEGGPVYRTPNNNSLSVSFYFVISS